MKTKFFIFLFIFLYPVLYATIINVFGGETRQTGITAAVNTDTVLVQPGTYVENINYNGKLITVASLFLTTQDTTYISSTIINGNSNGTVVTFNNSEDSTAVLCGFTIINGSADYGGGIFCYNNSSPSLENVTIIGNIAIFIGGGVCCWDYSSPRLEHVTISGNSASTAGGGIYCWDYSNLNLENVTISGNTADSGGGIYCYESSLILKNVTISDNTADSGGGIYCDYYSNPILQNVTILGNTADSGGGIYCYDNSIPSFNAIDRCNIFLNFTGSSGCDLYAINCDTIDVIVDTFSVLQPDDHFAYPINNFTFDILNSKIEQVDQDLYVSPDGSDDNSGLTVSDPLLTVSYALAKIHADSTNSLIIHLSNGTYSSSQTGERFPLNCRSYVSVLGEDETSTILDGEGLSGIMSCMNDNNFSIENMTIKNGSADSGGGIYCWDNSSPSIQNVTITGNNATVIGGGISCLDNSNPYLNNVIITGNTAGDGGGIYCDNSNPSLENVTISDNSSIYEGGGIYCEWYSSPNLINSILWNDSPEEIYISFSSSFTVTYSDIEGGFTGTGNIDSDPLFVDPGSGDYHLQSTSPCIDTGDPAFPLDPDGTIADMGAYYFHQITAPDPPQNVTIKIIGTDVHLSWDAVTGANSYIVYSSNDPYSGFVEDTSGSFAGENWSTSVINEKKFYFITAE